MAPVAKEMEDSVLRTLTLERPADELVADLLVADYFYSPANQHVFSAISTLAKKAMPPIWGAC